MNSAAKVLTLTATLVPPNRRAAILPQHFGKQMMVIEGTVYLFARQLIEGYTGGYWDFFEIDNGGFFMAIGEKLGLPSVPVTVHVEGNGYRDQMSMQAAGIVVCLMTFSHLSFQFQDIPQIAEHFHLLRDYALCHPEGEKIFAAID